MSNLEADPAEQRVCVENAAPAPGTELLQPREVPLGGARAMTVRRALPGRNRRMIGAWCFADVYGPTDVGARGGMQVPPHPHIGLQTVTWLVHGHVRHRDGLGSDQLVRPGRLSLMTAGHGIAHSERSPDQAPARLHGAQLWVALPEAEREGAPRFEHHDDLPVWRTGGARVTVIAGQVAGRRSPARVHTPLMGAEVVLSAGTGVDLPLDPAFEHGVLALDATVNALGHRVEAGSLLYLDPGRTEVGLRADQDAHLLVLGGEPFAEDLVMWWNFVGRGHEEIVAARTRWEGEREAPGTAPRFAPVTGDEGPPLPAPTLPNARLRPRPRHRK
ncbi:pirin family protein [Nocardiopsis sp. NRRL B-16309]|uniref:pirin family protein n=1 Tax=Nocardiopsis sp. NRRL B-16309 TaxID=1519494 RepID=UPI0006ADB88A|nr:pirin family protein [Nocardiopsis sp. NRRL B-16309]